MQSYIWIFRSGVNPLIMVARLNAVIGCYIVLSGLIRDIQEILSDDEDDDPE